MRKRLTRVVVPVVGLLAVTTALALVGIAPILLFPPSKEAGPRPIAPAASSEVASVAAPGVQPNDGSAFAGSAKSPEEPGTKSPDEGAPAAGSRPSAGGGTTDQPGLSGEPGVDQPDKVARPNDGPADAGKANADTDQGPGKPDHAKPDKGKPDKGKPDKGKPPEEGKQKTKHGKALGHSKDKANGEAKGHGKWQGRTSVAFPAGAAKPGNVHRPSASKHADGRHRPHARARG